MRRVLVIAVCAATLLPLTPARAQTVTQTITLPAYGSPAIPRTLYLMTGESTNGLLGYVFSLSKTYPNYFTLSPAPGGLGIEEYDIFFYSALDNPNPTGSYFDCSSGLTCSKYGQIPAGSKWAVVTMSVGFEGSFRYVS